MESVAVLLLPLYAAEMTADVFEGTVPVKTVKLADDVPAATVMFAGTAATDGLELASVTSAPPAGAGPESVTVPVELEPPVTVDGLSVRDESLGGGGGVTVSVAVLVALPAEAMMSTGVEEATATVVIENDAELRPAPTVTLGGTPATAGFVLESVTATPVPGAGPLSVTMPVED